MAKKRQLSHVPNRTHPDGPRARPFSSSSSSKLQNKQKNSKQNKPQSQNKQQQQQQQQKQHEKPTIPFTPHERILLVGEGDLSFAASLVRHHKCTAVTATVLEKSREDLEAKYPHVGENIEVFLAKEDEDDAETGKGEEDEDEDEDNWGEDSEVDDDERERRNKKSPPRNNRLVYNIDATKPLPNSVLPANTPGFSTIIFNFPHVGGLSTDVNRQVRHNQSLIVSFFTSILSKPNTLAPQGSVVITLFEAEPYTLWNVKDLARHAGLAVEKSFRFHAEAYPGYKHARTCGVIEGKGGGWRGEERKARSYVFKRKDVLAQAAKKRKKKGDDSDSEGED